MTPPEPWAHLPFFTTDWPGVQARLAADTRDILPAPDRIFAALAACAPDDVRVLILGQDPYPTPGHPNGLAFSTQADVTPLPKSLNNIFKEMQDDFGATPATGDLQHWADQGVLLLNTALTVPAGEAAGHMDLGWHTLIDQILAELDTSPRALLLWGRPAQARAATMRNPDHLRLETPHPSPLSAWRGFFGSRPFSRVNDWLRLRGQTPIDWTGP